MSTSQCKICSMDYDVQAEVNKELISPSRRSYQAIGDELGISDDAVRRHFVNGHIPQALADVAEEDRRASAASVLNDVIKLRATVMRTLERIESQEEPNPRLIFEAAKSLTPLLNLSARLAGEIEDRLRIDVNVAESQEFRHVLAIIFSVLDDENRARVLKALEAADAMKPLPAAADPNIVDVEALDE